MGGFGRGVRGETDGPGKGVAGMGVRAGAGQAVKEGAGQVVREGAGRALREAAGEEVEVLRSSGN